MTTNESSEIVAEELALFLDTYDPDQSALVDVVLTGDPASAPQGDQLAGAPAFEAVQGLLQLVAPWFLALVGQFFVSAARAPWWRADVLARSSGA